MLLNGSPLNAAPLNGVEPEPGSSAATITPVVSVVWGVRLMLGGVDVSDQLTGRIRIEREEGAATLADFVISLDAGPVNPASYIGQSVEIYFRRWTGSWTEQLRFKGQVIRPQYSMQERLISCDCSDRLQDAIEALSVAEVDALTGGLWSGDVFEAPAGRSRWDYAQERMSTRPASLQRNVIGNLHVTNWAAGTPAFVFPAGSVIDQSMDWMPVELSERVNVVELDLDYRFYRLRERHQDFVWMHPDISGPSIPGSFCLWHSDSTELPDLARITEACESAGYQAILAGATWIELPPTGVYCSPPVAWINNYSDLRLMLGGEWTAALRWAQPVTEQYRLRIEAPASIAQAGEVIRRDSIASESESDRQQAFEEEAFDAPEPDATLDAIGDWVVDLRETARLQDAFAVGVSMARVQILAAHRENRLGFQLPTPDTLGVTLEHTLRVEDQVAGEDIVSQAKACSLIDEWDFDEGSCLTTVMLAVSQGGGADDDPVIQPAYPPSTPAGSAASAISLPTQLGGEIGGPAYDEAIDGFSGNYDNYNTPGIERHPLGMSIPPAEIPAEHRDEFAATQVATYRVAIPNDLLEL